jgi:hypothetical protein
MVWRLGRQPASSMAFPFQRTSRAAIPAKRTLPPSEQVKLSPSHTCVGVQEKRAPAEFRKFAVFVSWGNVAAGQKNHECDCTDSNSAGTVATERMLYG